MVSLVNYDLSDGDSSDGAFLQEQAEEAEEEERQMEEDNEFELALMEEEERLREQAPMVGPRRGPLTTAPLARAQVMALQPKVNPFLCTASRKRPATADGDLPAMAAHERDRMLPQKAPAGARGRSSTTRITPEPKSVTVQDRIKSLAKPAAEGGVGPELAAPLEESAKKNVLRRLQGGNPIGEDNRQGALSLRQAQWQSRAVAQTCER